MTFELSKTDKVFIEARIQFGEENQMNVAQEELAECVAAISRVKRGRPDAIENLAEEIADVKVVIRQLELIFALENRVNFHFDRKVERLEQRIKNKRDW